MSKVRAADLLTLADFTPKQTAAWNSVVRDGMRFLLYGGARGGGKSRFLRWALLLLVLKWWEDSGRKLTGIKVVLFAEDYPTLTDRQIGPMEEEFPSWLGTLKRTQKDGLGFHFHSKWGGHHILLRNMGDDISRYKSAEFAAIAIDELTFWSYQDFSTLRGSLRWKGIANPVFLAATNPGGPGHLWVKDLWVDRILTRHQELKPLHDKFHFVRALPTDNPHLEESYWADLETLPEYLKKAWLYGDWNVFEGMVFTEWNPLAHTCKPFEIPEYWPRWIAVDPGYSQPACALWFTMEPDTNRIYVYREAYGPGQSDERMAKVCSAHSRGEVLDTGYGDPSLWTPYKSEKAGHTSGADVFHSHGIPLEPGNNNRINGKRKVHDVLGKLKDGKPGLVIFTTCVNLIRTLPALPYDKKAGKLEDVDTTAEDHAYDCLRYGLTRLAPESERGDNTELDEETKAWARHQQMVARHFG